MSKGMIRGYRLVPLLATLVTGAAAPAALAAGGPSTRATENVRANAGRINYGPNQRFAVRDVVVDRGGVEHVRLDRSYAGLRVIGGDVVLHQRTSGELLDVSQTLRTEVNLSTEPAVPAAVAEDRASAQFDDTPDATSARRVVYARDRAPVLAYDAVATGTTPEGSPSELHVIVRAADGAVLDSWDGIQHVDGGTGSGFFSGTVGLQTTVVAGGFSLKDPTRGDQYTCDMGNRTSRCAPFSDADNAWGSGTLGNRQSTGVDAQYGAAQTWDYYLTQHGRTGIDGDGRGAFSRVHYGRDYNNAYWSNGCFCLTYGDGDSTTYNPFGTLDVAGHEITHGVTSRTANLTYSGESGGLNEATSDIFGTMVEHAAANPRDTPDYKIGERLYRGNPDDAKALRYMYEPSLDGRSLDCYAPTVGSLDVHHSSGPANHFYYLLAEGSASSPPSPTCNGTKVVGVGRVAAARIYYRALTLYMVSNTDYAGARAATLQAATDLYGAFSTELDATAAAWSAVDVD